MTAQQRQARAPLLAVLAVVDAVAVLFALVAVADFLA